MSAGRGQSAHTLPGVEVSAKSQSETIEPSVSPASVSVEERKGRLIGEEGQVVRCFAFAGGGLDTIMQLGVVHALMVSGRRAPDVVVGISAGAVNAVTLAEVLQAGKNLPPQAARAAQVTCFRKLLKEYQEAPGVMIRSLLPDPYEIGFRSALRPIELPIHQQPEREERAAALQTRAGLIRLFNGLFKLRITVGTVTRAVRYGLGLREAAEIRCWHKRLLARTRCICGLFWLVSRNWHHLTQPLWLIERQVFTHWLLTRLDPGPNKDDQDRPSIRRRLYSLLQPKGMDAVRIILPRPFAKVGRFLDWVLGLLLPFFLLILAMAGRCILGLFFEAFRSPLSNMFLSSYDIGKDLGDSHALKQLYVRIFDPNYYGAGQVSMDSIVGSALKHDYANPLSRELSNPAEKVQQKLLSSYATQCPPISVIPVAAEIGSGELKPIPETASVVDALMAVTAVVPVYKAVEINGIQYIDGMNIANEPILALMRFLQGQLNSKAGEVHVYPVYPFPVLGKDECPGHAAGKPYTTLVEVVLRAMQLRRYRDAALERQLAKVYSRVLPKGIAKYSNKPSYINASVFAIEVEQPMELAQQINTADDEDTRRHLVLKAVAEGCRASLEAMLQPAIRQHAWRVRNERGENERCACCQDVLGPFACNGTPDGPGPGIPEVCSVCARELKKGLALKEDRAGWPLWPSAVEEKSSVNATTRIHEEQPNVAVTQREPLNSTFPSQEPMPQRPDQLPSRLGLECGPDAENRLLKPPWPEPRCVCGTERDGHDRPLVALLFSGGVFRGVFQFGVLNALSELGCRPDIVVGSSIGSITGALVAEVFRHRDANDRRELVARLCASMLGLDRLILTDRFADFVRRFTLRAAQTEFSLRDIDEVFRRYDAGDEEQFCDRVRRVVAGLERLFYVSPYELNDLIESLRRRQTGRASKLVSKYIQEFLDRHNLGMEILGAEPLKLLICKHILYTHDEEAKHSDAALFNRFAPDGIRLLATATNLVKGSLDVLDGCKSDSAFLLDGLLASSAFPGVFRPRWSWEVCSEVTSESQFIDGGVMDNLPLDAVVQVMDKAVPPIKRRPRVDGASIPHLLFAASLEANVAELPPDEVQSIAKDWMRLCRRARRLSYNHKLHLFAQSQHDLRWIYESQIGSHKTPPWEPMDIEVVAVKPEWLCGTFAMHPMLGFRREKQAASIAHGCASTMAQFGHLALDQSKRKWAEAWGIRSDLSEKFDPSSALLKRAPLKTEKIILEPQKHGKGSCWFCRDTPCPFSQEQLSKHQLPAVIRQELERIYLACGKAKTHRSERNGG